MSHDPPILSAALAARVSRLPVAIEPPADLWPAIAARLANRDETALDALLRRLPPELHADVDLWPGIEARLEGRGNPRVSIYAPSARHWGAMAASLAAMTIIASLAGLMFVTAERAVAPAGNDIARAVGTIRAEIAKVQGERLVIEVSLQRDGDNLTLHTLWTHTYQTELDLTGKAEQLMESHQGV